MRNEIEGAILILGSPNTKNGRLYDVAIGRCEQALVEYKNHPDYKFILTGGYGNHFNKSKLPHAQHLAQYLIQSGVQEKDILEYVESSNSIEDAILSKLSILKYNIKRIIIVTSDYHFNRAKYIFNRIFENLYVEISFSIKKTDPNDSELDIFKLNEHEKIALKKIMKYGIENYYNN
jgi:uncharacterized SAM-binding protein YcdF (DUF218 family)